MPDRARPQRDAPAPAARQPNAEADDEARRIREATFAADPLAAEDTHATATGAVATGALTGGVIGAATGPLGAVVGALGGAAAAVAAERAMHADQKDEEHLERTRRFPAAGSDAAASAASPTDRPKREEPVPERTISLREEELPHTGKGRTPERTIPLREEELVAHKELQESGEVVIRTVVEETPGRLEVSALREEIEVEHVPVNQVVSERRAPWEEESGDLVVPVYEEQMVVVKRLVLKEQLRIRRVSAREQQVFEDTLRRERLVVEDPDNTGLVREVYARDEDETEDGQAPREKARREKKREAGDQGFLNNLVKKALT